MSAAELLSSEGGSNGFKLALTSDGNYEGFEARTTTYDADTGTTQVEADVGIDGTLTERSQNTENGLVLVASGWSEYDGTGSVTAIHEDGSIDWQGQTVEGEAYFNQHSSGNGIDVSGQAIADYLVDERVDYDFTGLVGDAVFSEGALAFLTTYSFSDDVYRIGEGDSCTDPTDYNSFCNAVYHFIADGVSGIATSMEGVIGAGVGTGLPFNALRLYGDTETATWVELVDGGTANVYTIVTGTDTVVGVINTTWEERVVEGKTLYVVAMTEVLRAELNLRDHTDLFYTEYDGFVRVGGVAPGSQALTAAQYSFNDFAAQDVLDNFSAPGEGIALSCDYETPWDDVTGHPAVFNSYADFLLVVAACGGEDTITTADIAGTTWAYSAVFQGFAETEVIVFDADGTLIASEVTAGGTGDNLGTWSVSNNIVAVQMGSPIGYIDYWAIIDGKAITYSEEVQHGSDLVLDGTADGHIWQSGYVQQP